jgi:hypothetical protein
MKRGDIVVCVDDGSFSETKVEGLTLGKEYKVLQVSFPYLVSVVNDNNEVFSYNGSRFKLKEGKDKKHG